MTNADITREAIRAVKKRHSRVMLQSAAAEYERPTNELHHAYWARAVAAAM